MAHVVTERCVDCRYTDCCAVCPTESFVVVDSPAMLVIDPNVCADCAACVPECPVYAIYPEDEVPKPYKEWIAKNADLAAKGGQRVSQKTSALPGAIAIEKIRERERSRGWTVKDPSAVGGGTGGGEPSPAEAPSAPAPALAAPPAPAAPAPEPPAPAPAPATAPAPAPAAAMPAPAPSATPAPAAPVSPSAASGYRPVPIDLPPDPSSPMKGEKRYPPRPRLDVRPGGRIRIGGRAGIVKEIRTGVGDTYQDVKVQLDGEEKPVWYVYSSLQTMKEQGALDIIDPGPKPGLLARLLRRP
jgi:ferredoxin